MARRAELRKRLGGELEDLGTFNSTNASGDIADAAFDSGTEEVSSQLAELEARELSQIERSLIRLKQGSYGTCEVCQAKIPVARLNALPFSTTCISCQREMETYPDWSDRRGGGNWEKVSDADAPTEDVHEIDLSELEIDMTSNR
jgi:DnaK suppressor protein